jgi:hypothetical protein
MTDYIGGKVRKNIILFVVGRDDDGWVIAYISPTSA